MESLFTAVGNARLGPEGELGAQPLSPLGIPTRKAGNRGSGQLCDARKATPLLVAKPRPELQSIKVPKWPGACYAFPQLPQPLVDTPC